VPPDKGNSEEDPDPPEEPPSDPDDEIPIEKGEPSSLSAFLGIRMQIALGLAIVIGLYLKFRLRVRRHPWSQTQSRLRHYSSTAASSVATMFNLRQVKDGHWLDSSEPENSGVTSSRSRRSIDAFKLHGEMGHNYGTIHDR